MCLTNNNFKVKITFFCRLRSKMKTLYYDNIPAVLIEIYNCTLAQNSLQVPEYCRSVTNPPDQTPDYWTGSLPESLEPMLEPVQLGERKKNCAFTFKHLSLILYVLEVLLTVIQIQQRHFLCLLLALFFGLFGQLF